MPWTWRLEDGAGNGLDEPASPAHPNQSDAESWIGEHWRSLAEAGVAQASLFEDDAKIYGPMPLSDS